MAAADIEDNISGEDPDRISNRSIAKCLDEGLTVHKTAIRLCNSLLVSNIRHVEDITIDLFAQAFISGEDKKSIIDSQIPLAKADKLIDVLLEKDERTIEMFINLLERNRQGPMANNIRSVLQRVQKYNSRSTDESAITENTEIKIEVNEEEPIERRHSEGDVQSRATANTQDGVAKPGLLARVILTFLNKIKDGIASFEKFVLRHCGCVKKATSGSIILEVEADLWQLTHLIDDVKSGRFDQRFSQWVIMQGVIVKDTSKSLLADVQINIKYDHSNEQLEHCVLKQLLPSDVQLKHCTHLNLSKNCLTGVPDMKQMKSLRELNLCENHIKEIDCEALPLSINSLDLSYNDMIDIPRNMKRMVGLVDINLTCNAIRELQPKSFPATIVNINISHNKIRHIPSLTSWKCVEKVDLSRNKIELVSQESKFISNSIQELDISENKVTNLPKLGQRFHLKTLLASSNELKSIEAEQLPKNVEVLDLEKNKLEIIPDLSFMTKLNVLHLDYNQIKTMMGLPASLYAISVTHNKIETMHVKCFPNEIVCLGLQKHVHELNTLNTPSLEVLSDGYEGVMKFFKVEPQPVRYPHLQFERKDTKTELVETITRRQSIPFINPYAVEEGHVIATEYGGLFHMSDINVTFSIPPGAVDSNQHIYVQKFSVKEAIRANKDITSILLDVDATDTRSDIITVTPTGTIFKAHVLIRFPAIDQSESKNLKLLYRADMERSATSWLSVPQEKPGDDHNDTFSWFYDDSHCNVYTKYACSLFLVDEDRYRAQLQDKLLKATLWARFNALQKQLEVSLMLECEKCTKDRSSMEYSALMGEDDMLILVNEADAHAEIRLDIVDEWQLLRPIDNKQNISAEKICKREKHQTFLLCYKDKGATPTDVNMSVTIAQKDVIPVTIQNIEKIENLKFQFRPKTAPASQVGTGHHKTHPLHQGSTVSVLVSPSQPFLKRKPTKKIMGCKCRTCEQSTPSSGIVDLFGKGEAYNFKAENIQESPQGDLTPAIFHHSFSKLQNQLCRSLDKNPEGLLSLAAKVGYTLKKNLSPEKMLQYWNASRSQDDKWNDLVPMIKSQNLEDPLQILNRIIAEQC